MTPANWSYPTSMLSGRPTTHKCPLHAEGIPAMTPGGMRMPHKLDQRIWKGGFIDLADLLPEKLGQSEDMANTTAGEGESRKRK